MANDRGGGPGTSMGRGVRSTMDAPFGSGISKSGTGQTRAMKAPFDKPQDVGKNDIPVVMYAGGMSTKPASTVTAGQVSPPIGSTQAVGTRRFKNPR